MLQLAVKVGMEIRAQTGLDPAAVSEEVVLQLPLHCAWKSTAVESKPKGTSQEDVCYQPFYFQSMLH